MTTVWAYNIVDEVEVDVDDYRELVLRGSMNQAPATMTRFVYH